MMELGVGGQLADRAAGIVGYGIGMDARFEAREAHRGTPRTTEAPRIAVVIPCYRVADTVLAVVGRIGPEVFRIWVIDDACPDGTGEFVKRASSDPRVRVVRHVANKGVGGAVMSGYREALADGCDIIVKIDGDGQMPPELLPVFVGPIVAGQADYTKGNRFYDLANIRRMPAARIIGNAILSFMAKLSGGYWDIFDPANGYTAIHSAVAARLPFEKISERFFFESDMLFRLNTIRAVVVDVPMDPVYGDEVSNLKISRIAGEFFYKHARNAVKRVFYNYFLRDFSVASLELLAGLALLGFGSVFGGMRWVASANADVETSAGTVMLAALPVLAGIQLLIAFLGVDIVATPRRPIHLSVQARATANRHAMEDARGV
jgi:glycosyltransferase involved in cell wall biosynthesis